MSALRTAVTALGALPFAVLPFAVPVEPDADEAYELLRDELSGAVYQQAKPSWFDIVSQAFFEWLSGLRFDVSAGGQGVGLIIVLLLVVAIVVAAFFIFGAPARSRRSRVTGELFGVDDDREATQLRRDAEKHAAAGRFTEAIADMFRAIARGLAERTVVSVSPGTTAQNFAARASDAFPAHAAQLTAAATDFDSVRYLGDDGTRDAYDSIDRLERELRTARPTLPEAALVGSAPPGGDA